MSTSQVWMRKRDRGRRWVVWLCVVFQAQIADSWNPSVSDGSGAAAEGSAATDADVPPGAARRRGRPKGQFGNSAVRARLRAANVARMLRARCAKHQASRRRQMPGSSPTKDPSSREAGPHSEAACVVACRLAPAEGPSGTKHGNMLSEER